MPKLPTEAAGISSAFTPRFVAQEATIGSVPARKGLIRAGSLAFTRCIPLGCVQEEVLELVPQVNSTIQGQLYHHRLDCPRLAYLKAVPMASDTVSDEKYVCAP